MGKYINIIIACNCKSNKFLNLKQAPIFHIKAKHEAEQLAAVSKCATGLHQIVSRSIKSYYKPSFRDINKIVPESKEGESYHALHTLGL